MKKKLSESIDIPEGITAEYKDHLLLFNKGSTQVSRKIKIPGIKITVKDGKITFSSEKGNKNDFKVIKSNIAHMHNVFRGLDNKFVYKLQACNVHFPMTLKIEGKRLVISNFLGEKVPRYANIVADVEVDIKGQNITITSHNRESAGHTAANMEKATKIRNRDRRVFQDGIYIVEKPGRVL